MPPSPSDADHRWTRAQARDLWRFVLRRLHEERLPEVAGSLTYNTVLALVPVLTIAFAIFTTFPLFTTFRDALETYMVQSVMPKGIANTILGYLTQFSTKASKLSALGAVFLIVTAIFMFGTVDRTLNRIWRVSESRPFLQRMVVYWAIMTIGPLLIGASLTAASELLPVLGGDRHPSLLQAAAALLLSVALSTLAFALLYKTVPNRQVDWREALAGGLVAALAFEVTRRLFGFAIGLGGGYRAIYGALAAIPIFLIWVYLFWLITLLGAAVAAALPVVRHERWWHRAGPGSEFLDAVAVLQVLFDARANDSAAIDLQTLRERTRLGFAEADSLLQRMLDAGWVGRLRSQRPAGFGWRRRSGLRDERWALLANPDKLTLADVYRRFAFAPVAQSPLAGRVGQIVERGLSTSLSDYFSAPAAKLNSVSST